MSKVVLSSRNNALTTNLTNSKQQSISINSNSTTLHSDIGKLLDVDISQLSSECLGLFLLLSSKLASHPSEQKTTQTNPFKKWQKKFQACEISLLPLHFNRVSSLLNQQNYLPLNALSTLTRYLENTSIEFSERLDNLSQIGLPTTSSAANEKFVMLAPQTSALSMRLAFMMNHLNLLQEADLGTQCLKKLVITIAQLYSNTVKINDNAEEIIANTIATAITDALFDDSHQNGQAFDEIAKLIQFTTQLLIVGATTNIPSKKRMMSLLELLFILEDDAQRFGIILSVESNQVLINTLKIIAILTSIYDRNPSSSFDIVSEQSQKPSLSSWISLKTHSDWPSLLDQFFNSSYFHTYFGINDGQHPINQQAFFMMLSKYITNYSTQFPLNETQDDMHEKLMKFIVSCRSHLNEETFKQIFNQTFDALEIENTVDQIFFAQIAEKINDSNSQIDSLRCMATRLILMGLSHRSINGLTTCGSFQQMFNAEVPRLDAENLESIRVFYNTLSKQDKTNLIKELLFTLIAQAEPINQAALSEKPIVKEEPYSLKANSIVLRRYRASNNNIFSEEKKRNKNDNNPHDINFSV